MSEPVRFNPVTYVDVSTAVLAGLVIEWSVLRDEASVVSNDPKAKADFVMHLAEVCQSWDRRRGLGGVTPQAAMDDAASYLLEHGMTEAQKHRVAEKIHQVVARSEATALLLTRLRGTI